MPPMNFSGAKVGKLAMATMPPSRTSMTTADALTPLPVPMVPLTGATRFARARSHTYCTGALMVR